MASTQQLKLGVSNNPFEDLIPVGRPSEQSRPSTRMYNSTMSRTTFGQYEQTIFATLESEPHRNFTCACPPELYKDSDKCHVCSQPSSSLLKSAKNCQFCGKSVCKECSRHSRRDPNNSEQTLRVCDLCHQQILYKRIIEAFMQQKQEKDHEREEITEECNAKKDELHKKQITNEEVNLQMQTQRHKYDRVLDERRQKVTMQKEKQNKCLIDNSALKEKINRLNEEISIQEQELSNISASLYEHHEKKNTLDHTLESKEVDHQRVLGKYETLSKDIDMRRLQQQQVQLSTDYTDEMQISEKPSSKQQYQASLIDYNHLQSSLNYQDKLIPNSRLSNQNGKKKKHRGPKKDQATIDGCCQSGGKCTIY